jgi:hypothetical protein
MAGFINVIQRWWIILLILGVLLALILIILTPWNISPTPGAEL